MWNYSRTIPLLFVFLCAACGTQTLETTEMVDDVPFLERKTIQSEKAPKAIGPYSQAVQVGNTVYLAGQIAINPTTDEMVTNDIEAETRQIMANLEAVLEAADMDFGDVVKTSIFMQDLSDFGAVNEVYGSYFEKSPPARETVQVAALPKNAGLEISMIAVKAD